MRLCRSRFLLRIEDMTPNMTVDDLHHQTAQRASACRDGLQNREAIAVVVVFQLALDSADLAPDLLDPQDQLLAVAHCVSHCGTIPWGGIVEAVKLTAEKERER